MNSQIRYIFLVLCASLLFEASLQAQNKEDERMRQVVHQSLVHYRYCKVVGCENGKPYPSYITPTRIWFNEASRAELLRLLENQWTASEKQELAEKSVRKNLEIRLSNLAKSKENPELLPRFKKSLQKQLDSLTKVSQMVRPDTFPPYQQAIEKRVQEIEQLKLDDVLIYVAGFLDDTRYVPVLKNAIGDKIHYDQHTVKLALARLKVEPYHSEMLKHYEIDLNYIKKVKKNHRQLSSYYDEKSSGLLYILSQESILEIGNFLPVELKVTDSRVLNTSDVGYSPISRRTFEDIASRLANKEILDYAKSNINELNVNPTEFRISQEEPIDKKHITFLQRWLKANYGRYELVRD